MAMKRSRSPVPGRSAPHSPPSKKFGHSLSPIGTMPGSGLHDSSISPASKSGYPSDKFALYPSVQPGTLQDMMQDVSSDDSLYSDDDEPAPANACSQCQKKCVATTCLKCRQGEAILHCPDCADLVHPDSLHNHQTDSFMQSFIDVLPDINNMRYLAFTDVCEQLTETCDILDVELETLDDSGQRSTGDSWEISLSELHSLVDSLHNSVAQLPITIQVSNAVIEQVTSLTDRSRELEVQVRALQETNTQTTFLVKTKDVSDWLTKLKVQATSLPPGIRDKAWLLSRQNFLESLLSQIQISGPEKVRLLSQEALSLDPHRSTTLEAAASLTSNLQSTLQSINHLLQDISIALGIHLRFEGNHDLLKQCLKPHDGIVEAHAVFAKLTKHAGEISKLTLLDVIDIEIQHELERDRYSLLQQLSGALTTISVQIADYESYKNVSKSTSAALPQLLGCIHRYQYDQAISAAIKTKYAETQDLVCAMTAASKKLEENASDTCKGRVRVDLRLIEKKWQYINEKMFDINLDLSKIEEANVSHCDSPARSDVSDMDLCEVGHSDIEDFSKRVASRVQAAHGDNVAVSVDNVSEQCPLEFLTRLMCQCGEVSPSGHNIFIYNNGEDAMRAVRVLDGLAVFDKLLVVKADSKTEPLLKTFDSPSPAQLSDDNTASHKINNLLKMQHGGFLKPGTCSLRIQNHDQPHITDTEMRNIFKLCGHVSQWVPESAGVNLCTYDDSHHAMRAMRLLNQKGFVVCPVDSEFTVHVQPPELAQKLLDDVIDRKIDKAIHHLVVDRAANHKEKYFSCKICRKKFLTHSEELTHMLSHMAGDNDLDPEEPEDKQYTKPIAHADGLPLAKNDIKEQTQELFWHLLRMYKVPSRSTYSEAVELVRRDWRWAMLGEFNRKRVFDEYISELLKEENAQHDSFRSSLSRLEKFLEEELKKHGHPFFTYREAEERYGDRDVWKNVNSSGTQHTLFKYILTKLRKEVELQRTVLVTSDTQSITKPDIDFLLPDPKWPKMYEWYKKKSQTIALTFTSNDDAKEAVAAIMDSEYYKDNNFDVVVEGNIGLEKRSDSTEKHSASMEKPPKCNSQREDKIPSSNRSPDITEILSAAITELEEFLIKELKSVGYPFFSFSEAEKRYSDNDAWKGVTDIEKRKEMFCCVRSQLTHETTSQRNVYITCKTRSITQHDVGIILADTEWNHLYEWCRYGEQTILLTFSSEEKAAETVTAARMSGNFRECKLTTKLETIYTDSKGNQYTITQGKPAGDEPSRMAIAQLEKLFLKELRYEPPPFMTFRQAEERYGDRHVWRAVPDGDTRFKLFSDARKSREILSKGTVLFTSKRKSVSKSDVDSVLPAPEWSKLYEWRRVGKKVMLVFESEDAAAKAVEAAQMSDYRKIKKIEVVIEADIVINAHSSSSPCVSERSPPRERSSIKHDRKKIAQRERSQGQRSQSRSLSLSSLESVPDRSAHGGQTNISPIVID